MVIKIEPEVLIYDIESFTPGARPNSDVDEFRLFAAYSYKTKKYYLLTKKEDIQRIIDAHRILVGYNNAGTRNNPGYDNPVLQRFGIDFKYKIIIDMCSIMKQRCGGMKIKKGMLGNLLMEFKLDYVTRMLDLVDNDSSKLEIDYSMFKKPVWTKEEFNEIAIYAKRDVEVTKKLYEWIEDYFWNFRDFLREEDVTKKVYLTCGLAVFAYKAVCKRLGLKDSFSGRISEGSFGGGYVAYPAGEIFSGRLLLFDFSSLYPNLFIQCNLFANHCTCCEPHEKWTGDNFFKVKGQYCTKKMSKLSNLLKELFLMRLQYKKDKNPAEYSIKIIMNSLYGAVSNPAFESIYNLTAAEDCTALGRQCTKYVRKRFREEGFKNVMSDTDSVCVQVPEHLTKEYANKLAVKITEELQSHMIYPW